MKQPSHPELEEVTLSRALYALGDPVRLEVLRTLADGNEHPNSDFVHIPLAQSTLSHHVKTLREVGIARARFEGTRCFLSLRPEFEQRFPSLLATVLHLSADETLRQGQTPDQRTLDKRPR